MFYKNLLLITFSLTIFAIKSIAQNQQLNRRILHKLEENEILHYDEAVVHTSINSSNFCLVIEDTIKSTKSFVYNGKKILETKTEDWFNINTGSLDLNSPNGFVLDYSMDNKSYINLNGIVLGPFEQARSMFCSETMEIGYFYKLGDKYYFKVNNQKYGPFLGDHNSIYLFDSKRTFNYEYESNYSAVVAGNDYLEIVDEKQLLLNGKIVNSEHDDIRGIRSLSYVSKDKFGYLSEKNSNGTCDVWINGSVIDNYDFRPYSSDKFILTNKDFYFISNSTNQIFKNGNPIFTNVYYVFDYNENGDFLYQNSENTLFLNNDILFQNNEASISQAEFVSLNNYAFSYFLNEVNYVNSSQGNYGPYSNINHLQFNKSGKLKFNFDQEDGAFSFEDGQISALKDSPNFYSVSIIASLKFEGHSFESSYKYDYVVIDGEPYGASPALQSWIDHKNKSFNWTALEKNEYVVYSLSIK